MLIPEDLGISKSAASVLESTLVGWHGSVDLAGLVGDQKWAEILARTEGAGLAGRLFAD